VAYDLLGDRAEAEDAVQEALARACEGWERLRDSEALEAWFQRVVVHVSLRILRRRRIWRGFWHLLGRDETQRPDEGSPDGARLRAALEALPAMQKAALVLRYGHDLSVEEIGRHLGVGAGTVKTHLGRGLTRLRELLGGRRDAGTRP
jgi:RNA polymerase sigma-70 factor (ECF subfamily)